MGVESAVCQPGCCAGASPCVSNTSAWGPTRSAAGVEVQSMGNTREARQGAWRWRGGLGGLYGQRGGLVQGDG